MKTIVAIIDDDRFFVWWLVACLFLATKFPGLIWWTLS